MIFFYKSGHITDQPTWSFSGMTECGLDPMTYSVKVNDGINTVCEDDVTSVVEVEAGSITIRSCDDRNEYG